jgi:hypothetical protein
MVLAYDWMWSDFTKFAASVGVVACPASEDVVLGFIMWLDLCGHGGHIAIALATIAHHHTLARLALPTCLLRMRLLVDGVEHSWAKHMK